MFGAIALLFIFTIMMLNLNILTESIITNHFFLLSSICYSSCIIQLTNLINSTLNSTFNNSNITINNTTNIEIISNLLYSNYYTWLILSSIILLLSMLIAILITSNEENSSINQQLFTQIQRNSNN